MSPVHIEPSEKQKANPFAELFEASMQGVVLKEGELVKGKVVRVTRDTVVVDIGFKSEGEVPIAEFKNARGELTAQVGEKVDILIESLENDEGMLILSKERADAMRTWDRLVEIAEKDSEVEGIVVAKVKGGLSVDIGVRAFLPGSQIDLRPAKNLDRYLRQTYRFKIIKLNKRRGNVVLSRKVLLEKERESLRTETLAHLSEGQIFNGVVKNITDYGVFVDLGGIDGLLHVTDMSWGRVGHPSELFKVGDEIRVVVLKFDRETNKVSLGYKQLLADPWADVENTFVVGSRVHGKVVSLTDYGAFVQLADGVEGLIHISEMTWSKKVKHPSKVLSVGQEVDAIVLDIDLDQKRISLGLKQILPNPWQEIEDKYRVGTQVTGQVKNIADFGVFVDVGASVDGLIHISDLAWVQNFDHPSEVIAKNAEVQAVVLNIDAEHERFALGIKQLTPDPWEAIRSTCNVGSEFQGKVIALRPSGVVVALGDHIEGFIPKEETPTTLAEGNELKVKVAKMDPGERRLFVTAV